MRRDGEDVRDGEGMSVNILRNILAWALLIGQGVRDDVRAMRRIL